MIQLTQIENRVLTLIREFTQDLPTPRKEIVNFLKKRGIEERTIRDALSSFISKNIIFKSEDLSDMRAVNLEVSPYV